MTTARLIDVPYSDLHPTLRALSEAGADASLADEIRRPGNGARAVAALRAEFLGTSAVVQKTSFAHIADALVTQQIERIQRWNAEHKLGFAKADFANLASPPAWPNGVLPMVILTAYLPEHKGVGGIQRTFETWWKIAAGEQENSWRWESLLSDPEHLALLEGATHEPGLRWEALDLGANWDKKDGIAPAMVRNLSTSPNASVLAAAAHFPGWIRRMDGINMPYVWMPGYRVTVPGIDAWRGVPILDFSRAYRRLQLRADTDVFRDSGYAVPVRLGVA